MPGGQRIVDGEFYLHRHAAGKEMKTAGKAQPFAILTLKSTRNTDNCPQRTGIFQHDLLNTGITILCPIHTKQTCAPTGTEQFSALLMDHGKGSEFNGID